MPKLHGNHKFMPTYTKIGQMFIWFNYISYFLRLKSSSVAIGFAHLTGHMKLTWVNLESTTLSNIIYPNCKQGVRCFVVSDQFRILASM